MRGRPLTARFSQRCRCGVNTAPGDNIGYDFKTRQVVQCPACTIETKPVSALVEFAYRDFRFAIQATALAWIAVPLPGQHKDAHKFAKGAASAWLKAGGPGAEMVPRTFKADDIERIRQLCIRGVMEPLVALKSIYEIVDKYSGRLIK